MLDLVGQRNFLIDRSVSYTRPLVCFQGLVSINLGLLCITFGFAPGLLVCLGTALAESEQTQKADHGFGWCLLSVKLYLVGTACTKIWWQLNPQTCEKLFKKKTGAHPHFLVIKVKIKFSNHFSSLCSRLQSDFLVQCFVLFSHKYAKDIKCSKDFSLAILFCTRSNCEIVLKKQNNTVKPILP